MKKIAILLTTTLMLMMTGLCLQSCKDDDEGAGDSAQKLLVGTWRCDWEEDEDEYGYDIMTLNADGTGTLHTYEYFYGSVDEDDYDISYTYDADTKKLTIKVIGMTQVITLNNLSASEFSYTDEDGTVMVYKKLLGKRE